MAAVNSGSLFSSFVSLTLCAAGAGILSFPAAAGYSSPAILVVCTIAMNAIAALTDLILAEEAFRHSASMKARTFDELVWRSLGKGHYLAVTAQILFGLTGALVGFLCVAGDLATPVVQTLCAPRDEAQQEPGAACAILARREAVILLFATFIALPLASCARIHNLRAASALAVAAVVAVAALVVARGAAGPPAASALNQAAPSPLGVFLTLPIVVYASGNHVQAVNIALDGSDTTRRYFSRSIFACFATITVIYIATGVAGYLAFGSDTHGNVLTNFSLGDTPADIAKILMASKLTK